MRGRDLWGAALLAGLLATAPRAEVVHFCWVGANGYTMTGTLAFPDALREAEVITEADVTAFRAQGYKDGALLGAWDAQRREPGDTWYLRYLPRQGRFPVGEEVPGPMDQGWNADGTASDCGPGEWGFNAGNYAQDFCLDGEWLEESGVPPPTPFHAQAAPIADPTCAGTPLVSKRRRPAP